MILSFHVWRKTIRAGMPAILSTTTDAAAAEERAESRDRDVFSQAFPAHYLFTKQLLCGYQYHNLLQACMATPARSASVALEIMCI